MSEPKNESLQIFGSLVAGFAQACVNLNIVAGQRAGRLLSNYEFGAWYPYERLRELERTVIDSYTSSEPILERVGIEMMKAWYTFGPGKEFIKRGEDFLHFQTGSLGYASVVKGPPEEVGLFVLEHIDSATGRAVNPLHHPLRQTPGARRAHRRHERPWRPRLRGRRL
jgi:hypothetical protein